MNTAGNMNSLMNGFPDLLGVEKGLPKGNIGKGRSMDGTGKDEMPFLQMLKKSLLSISKSNVVAMEEGHITKQEETDLRDGTVKNISSLKKEDLNALFFALAGLAKDGLEKEAGTIFLANDGGKENAANLFIYHGLQKGDFNNTILAERNSQDLSVWGVKDLLNDIMTGFERARSGSESGPVYGKAKQEIVDVLKMFGFSEKEVEGLLSAGKNESKQNELAVRETSDIGRDTGKELSDLKTDKLSSASKGIVKEFRESRSQHGNTLALATGEESENMKKSMTAMKSNGSEGTKIEAINTEMKQTAKVQNPWLDKTIAALGAANKDNVKNMEKAGDLLSGKDSTGKNDKTSFLKAVNAQGSDEKKAYTKFSNEGGIKSIEIPKMEDFHKEGRLLHRSGDGNHVTVSQGSMLSVDTNENRGTVTMTPRVVINQVVNTVGKKLSKGFGRIRIELNPPHLGTVDMDVLVRGSKVHVILQTENYDVKHLLQSSTEQLKTSLHQQGLVADTITVSVQEKSGGNHYEYSQNGTLYQEMSDRGSDRDNQKGFHNSVGDDLSLQAEGKSNVDSDGQINIFA